MRAFAGITLAALIVAAVPSPGMAKERMSLEEANRRWAGARCVSRIPMTLKNAKADDGWAKCKWIFRTPQHGNERVRVLVTQPDQVLSRYPGGTLPAGTEFIAAGWKTEKPDDRGTLYLELEHVELGVKARVTYGKDWVGMVEVNALDEFEQWARLSMFEIVETPSEKLVDVSPSAGAAAPVESELAAAEALGIRMLGASTEPLTAKAGGSISLVLTYEVLGVAPGGSVEVLETRTIRRDDRVLTTLEAAVRQGTGIHRSTQALTIPVAVAPGVLTLEASVEVGGIHSATSVLFKVAGP